MSRAAFRDVAALLLRPSELREWRAGCDRRDRAAASDAERRRLRRLVDECACGNDPTRPLSSSELAACTCVAALLRAPATFEQLGTNAPLRNKKGGLVMLSNGSMPVQLPLSLRACLFNACSAYCCYAPAADLEGTRGLRARDLAGITDDRVRATVQLQYVARFCRAMECLFAERGLMRDVQRLILLRVCEVCG